MKVDSQSGTMGRHIPRNKGPRKGCEEITSRHVSSNTSITPRSKNDRNNNCELPPKTNKLNKPIGESEDSTIDNENVNVVDSLSEDENDNNSVNRESTDDIAQQFSQLNIQSKEDKKPQKEDKKSNDETPKDRDKNDVKEESKPDTDNKEEGETVSRGPERPGRGVHLTPYSRSQEIRLCSSNRTSGGSVSVGPALADSEESHEIARDFIHDDQLSTEDLSKEAEVALSALADIYPTDPEFWQKLQNGISLEDLTEVVGNNHLPYSSNEDLTGQTNPLPDVDSRQGYGGISPQLGFDTSSTIYEGVCQESPSSSSQGYGGSSPESLPSVWDYYQNLSPPQYVPSLSAVQGSPPYSPSNHLYSPQTSHNSYSTDSSESFSSSFQSPPSSPEQQLPTVLAQHQRPATALPSSMYITSNAVATPQNIPTVSSPSSFLQVQNSTPPHNIPAISSPTGFLQVQNSATSQKISTKSSPTSFLQVQNSISSQNIRTLSPQTSFLQSQNSASSQNMSTVSSKTSYMQSHNLPTPQNIPMLASQAQTSTSSQNISIVPSQMNFPPLTGPQNTPTPPCQVGFQQPQIPASMQIVFLPPQQPQIQRPTSSSFRPILPAPGPVRTAKQELEEMIDGDTRNKLFKRFLPTCTKTDEDGDTQLMIAVCSQQATLLQHVYGIVEALRIRAPDNLNAKNKVGQTALYNACIMQPQRPLVLVRYLTENLLELGVDIAQDKFQNGRTLVQCVRQTEHSEILDYLVKLKTASGNPVFSP